MRDEDAAVADLTNQGGEGLLVALSRLAHDRSQHDQGGWGCRRGILSDRGVSSGQDGCSIADDAELWRGRGLKPRGYSLGQKY